MPLCMQAAIGCCICAQDSLDPLQLVLVVFSCHQLQLYIYIAQKNFTCTHRWSTPATCTHGATYCVVAVVVVAIYSVYIIIIHVCVCVHVCWCLYIYIIVHMLCGGIYVMVHVRILYTCTKCGRW